MIAIDCETTGVDRYHGSQPFFVNICEDGVITSWRADVDYLTRTPLWSVQDLRAMRVKLLSRGVRKVFHNAKFDIPMLDTIMPGIEDEWDWEHTECTLISSHLVNSIDPHDLTSQVLIHLDYDIRPVERSIEKAATEARRLCRTKDFQARHGKWRIATEGEPTMPSAKEKTWQFDMWLPHAVAKAENYPPDHPWWTVLEEYSNPDVEVLETLYNRHKEIITSKGLLPIYKERLKVLKQLCKMEKEGITGSRVRLEEQDTKFDRAAEESRTICCGIASTYKDATGEPYQLDMPKGGMNNSLKAFLLDHLKLESPIETDKGAPSFNKDAVEHFLLTLPRNSRELKFVEHMQNRRSAGTAKGYLESYQKYWRETDDPDFFKIHTKINPCGTHTIRSSSQDPNSQQVSKKEGFNLRYTFGPLPGEEWWSIDYDNLELRIPGYESGEEKMIEIFEQPDKAPFFGSYHLLNASIVYPELFWPLAEQKGAFKKMYAATWYQWLKNAGFALIYGCMEDRFDLTARRPGGYQLLRKNLPKLFKLNNKWIDYAEKWGYVETIPDKEICPERGYPIYCARNNWSKISPTIPLNYHVQSTACWVKMRAMFKVQEYIDRNKLPIKILLDIHDELVFKAPFVPEQGNRPRMEKIRGIMASLGDCIGIPLTCGLSYHPNNWEVAV